MRDITSNTQSYYRYDGKFYIPSKRTAFRINDVFFDGRDYSLKVIEDAQDILELAYMAPELYVILEEVTIQN